MRAANAGLYDAAGLATLARRLASGGRLAVWSARPDAPFAARRGPDDVIYVATRRAGGRST